MMVSMNILSARFVLFNVLDNLYNELQKGLCSITHDSLTLPLLHKMGGNGSSKETLTSFFFFVLLLHATKIFTHVGVVIPRVPATCTPLASFREVVHVRVTKSVSTYNMKKLDKLEVRIDVQMIIDSMAIWTLVILLTISTSVSTVLR